MTKHLLIGTLILSAILLGGCAKPAPAPAPEGPLPAQSFRRDWAADLKLERGDEVERLFVREDLLFAYTKKNYVYALTRGGANSSAGGVMRLAAVKIKESPVKPFPPVVLKDHIVVPTSSTLELFTRKTGKFILSYNTNLSLRTNVAGWPGGSKIYFGADHPGGGRAVGINTAGSQYKPVSQLWELMADKGDSINGAPAMWMGVVYVGFGDGKVYAVNADTRAPIWATSTGLTFLTFGPIQADLKADEGGVYVASTDTKLYCLDRIQGKVKWTFYAGISLRHAPEVTATMLYLPVFGRGIVAIDKMAGGATREPKWSVNDCVKLVAEDEKHAYFQRKDNVVVALDKATGEQKFASKRRDFIAFATNTSKDGMIYTATAGGHVYGIAPVLAPGKVGEIAWTPVEPGVDMLAMQ